MGTTALVYLRGRQRVRALPPGVEDALVVAADGGLAEAVRLGLQVDVVVGDLDCASPAEVAAARQAGAEVARHPEDKDATDLELAIGAGARRRRRSDRRGRRRTAAGSTICWATRCSSRRRAGPRRPSTRSSATRSSRRPPRAHAARCGRVAREPRGVGRPGSRCRHRWPPLAARRRRPGARHRRGGQQRVRGADRARARARAAWWSPCQPGGAS